MIELAALMLETRCASQSNIRYCRGWCVAVVPMSVISVAPNVRDNRSPDAWGRGVVPPGHRGQEDVRPERGPAGWARALQL